MYICIYMYIYVHIYVCVWNHNPWTGTGNPHEVGITMHQTISTNDEFGPTVATRQVSVATMDVPSQPRFHKKKFVLPQPHTDDIVPKMHEEWNRIVCQGFICWQYITCSYPSTCLRPDKENAKKKKMLTDMSAPSLAEHWDSEWQSQWCVRLHGIGRARWWCAGASWLGIPCV